MRRPERRGRLMDAITHICTLDHVAKMTDDDPELPEAIVWNDDNLTMARSSEPLPVRKKQSPH